MALVIVLLWIVLGAVGLAVFAIYAVCNGEKITYSGIIGLLRIFILYVCVVFIVGVVISCINDGLNSFKSELKTDANDRYEYRDGKLIFIEAKCLVGSISHKKTLILSEDNIEIVNNGKKTVCPYNTLKEITFSRAFVGYKAVIKYSGGFLGCKTTFYFNQKDTFYFLKTVFKDYCKNRCVITESL